MLFAIHSANLH